MIFCVRRVATDINAVGKLAGKCFCLDSVAMNKLVLLEDVSETKEFNWNFYLTIEKYFWQSFKCFMSRSLQFLDHGI